MGGGHAVRRFAIAWLLSALFGCVQEPQGYTGTGATIFIQLQTAANIGGKGGGGRRRGTGLGGRCGRGASRTGVQRHPDGLCSSAGGQAVCHSHAHSMRRHFNHRGAPRGYLRVEHPGRGEATAGLGRKTVTSWAGHNEETFWRDLFYGLGCVLLASACETDGRLQSAKLSRPRNLYRLLSCVGVGYGFVVL